MVTDSGLKTELKKVEVSNNREGTELMDEKAKTELKNFKDYYDGASQDIKQKLDAQYNKYLGEELKQDSELKNKLNASEIKESSEIDEQAIADLKTVRNLNDVLNSYPNISSPEYRAIKRMIEENIENLSRETKKTLSNPESTEGN